MTMDNKRPFTSRANHLCLTDTVKLQAQDKPIQRSQGIPRLCLLDLGNVNEMSPLLCFYLSPYLIKADSEVLHTQVQLLQRVLKLLCHLQAQYMTIMFKMCAWRFLLFSVRDCILQSDCMLMCAPDSLIE